MLYFFEKQNNHRHSSACHLQEGQPYPEDGVELLVHDVQREDAEAVQLLLPAAAAEAGIRKKRPTLHIPEYENDIRNNFKMKKDRKRPTRVFDTRTHYYYYTTHAHEFTDTEIEKMNTFRIQ